MPTAQQQVGTDFSTLAEANEKRRALAFHNCDASVVLYVSDEGSTSVGDGFPVEPKTSLLLSEIEGVDITKKWVGVAASTITVAILEGFYKPNPQPAEPDIQDPNNFTDPRA